MYKCGGCIGVKNVNKDILGAQSCQLGVAGPQMMVYKHPPVH
jgi:hypothetical protein